MDVRQSILIVDDHRSIREPLTRYMRKFDFEVEAVKDGQAMRERLAQRAFDLVVLDVMLPGENGLTLCRHVAENVGIPVILLTALAEQADRVAGLEIGADDYVVKPFDPRELVARIRSVLRRGARVEAAAQAAEGESQRQPNRRFVFDGWTLDVDARELNDPQQQAVPLTTAEFHLLRVLVENANRVLSRSQLLDHTERHGGTAFDRSIDSQVSRLRKKLEPDPRRPSLLKTVRGDGYLLTVRALAGPA